VIDVDGMGFTTKVDALISFVGDCNGFLFIPDKLAGNC
jgi:hypothetical protein